MESPKIPDDQFDPKKHVAEYRRTCKGCGKVWHSLEAREKDIQKNIKTNAFAGCAFCGNPFAQLQANRNVSAGQEELTRLRKCPNCGSSNFKEERLIYEKKP
jgi:hypothetical protein